MKNYHFIELLKKYGIEVQLSGNNILIDGNNKYWYFETVEKIDEDFPYNIYFRNFDHLLLSELVSMPRKIDVIFECIKVLSLKSLIYLSNKSKFISIRSIHLEHLKEISEEQKLILKDVNNISFYEDLLNVKGNIYIKGQVPNIQNGKNAIFSGNIYCTNITKPEGSFYGKELKGSIYINFEKYNKHNISFDFDIIDKDAMIKINVKKGINLNLFITSNNNKGKIFLNNVNKIYFGKDFSGELVVSNNYIPELYFAVNKINLENIHLKTDVLKIEIGNKKLESISGDGSIEAYKIIIISVFTPIEIQYKILNYINSILKSKSFIKFKKIEFIDFGEKFEKEVNYKNILSHLLYEYNPTMCFLCCMKRIKSGLELR